MKKKKKWKSLHLCCWIGTGIRNRCNVALEKMVDWVAVQVYIMSTLDFHIPRSLSAINS